MRGEKIVEDPSNIKDPCLFTEKLLDFKIEIDDIIASCFGNH